MRNILTFGALEVVTRNSIFPCIMASITLLPKYIPYGNANVRKTLFVNIVSNVGSDEFLAKVLWLVDWLISFGLVETFFKTSVRHLLVAYKSFKASFGQT